MKLSKEQIKNILPHRDPILLVDEVTDINDTSIEATFFVAPDLPVLAGHFPEQPILPGIYLIEALAQTADLLLLSIPGNEGLLPLFASVMQMRFLRPAYPGDTLTLSASISGNFGDGLYECQVTALQKGKKIASGKLSLALKETLLH